MSVNGNHDNDEPIGFVYGPLDSFNYDPPLNTQNNRIEATICHGDVISLVTAVSRAYEQDGYMEMQPLDDVDWTEFGAGQIFQVSKSDLKLKRVSPLNYTRFDTVVSKVVIKRIKTWSMAERQVRSLSREIQILHHCRASKNIVDMQGVGWFYNSDADVRIPEPVLMLEEAHDTLQLLVDPSVNLSARNMLSIFDDIVHGLSELHQCGIVHGDIKTTNVLIFPDVRYDEGVQVGTFTAKLSDFSHAVLDNGNRQHLPGGTSIYAAPESGDDLNFSQLKLTDIYSLGVLYAVVATKKEDTPSLDAFKAMVDVGNLPSGFADRIHQQVARDTEGSAFQQRQVNLMLALFTSTLQSDPRNRDLERLKRCFDEYFERSRLSTNSTILTDPPATDLVIGYGKFMNLSGFVKDLIVKGLHDIVSFGEGDSRHSGALFHLAVIYLSKFATPHASVAEGLKFLIQSADEGDLRAQALHGRLQSAYGTDAQEYQQPRIDWLYAAAKAGYQIAQVDIQALDTSLAREALKEYADSYIQTLFIERAMEDNPWAHESEETVDIISESIRTSARFRVHLAAATGSTDTLNSLLRENDSLLNITNDAGDTPLLSACRFGQFQTAMALLRRSADASLPNKVGENGLHLLWRFNEQQAEHLIDMLLQQGANPRQEACSSNRANVWDLIPSLVATPIERLAAYKRVDLVDLLTRRGCKIFPRNGNQMRRMLLLAIRLQHDDMQRYLIEYALRDHPDYRSDLLPLCQVKWEYKGRKRSFLDAALVGWVRQTGVGVDIPLDFWQACSHGRLRSASMKATFYNVMRLWHPSSMQEQVLDRSVALAIEERAYDALEHLIHLKIVGTDATQRRRTSLRRFCWIGSTGTRKDLPEPAGDSLIGLSKLPVRYIDQLDYGPLTMTQRAVMRGDRVLFTILVGKLGANLTLPFHLMHIQGQINCYAAAALSKHQDLWFVDEFYRMNIPFYHPYEGLEHPRFAWQHPLYHALRNRSWVLASWLLSRGASLSDRVGDYTVLELAVQSSRSQKQLLDFLFPLDHPQRSITWLIPDTMVVNGGYPIFASVFKTINAMGVNATGQASNLSSIWLGLLNHYHKVENIPVFGQQSVLGMTIDLYRRCFRISVSQVSFNMNIAPSVSTRIKIECANRPPRIRIKVELNADTRRPRFQSLSSLVATQVFGSPIDAIPIRTWLASGLWRYNYWPSARHKTLRMYAATILILAGTVGLVAFVVWQFYIPRGFSWLKKFGIWVVIALCIWIPVSLVTGMAVFFVGFFLSTIAWLVNLVVRVLVGPSFLPEWLFFDPDAEWMPNMSWLPGGNPWS